MDCGASIVKYILFIFNMLALVCGILLIVFGSLVLSNLGDIRDFADTFETSSIPISIIVIGCIIFIISFVGCCGAIREDTCLTMTYSIFMLILFVLQMIMVVYIWIERESFLNAMNKIVDKAWEQRHDKGHYMDVFQSGFNCCGRVGVQDYTKEIVPNSCCGASATSCSYELARNKPGCSQQFRTFISTNIAIAQYAGLVVAGVELIAFIFACCIANQARNERRRAAYYT
ncbi:23 kDa integral membrane protein-like [Episyrphus balteatus]|uniref:23 kDa integral membrane protein-like n=1 Tax=Episyrphus balteatus TaxID=286459 RepID=UPI0024864705|nr:23 kDa integral membrane protein-like [Episyrphus balteatus]